MALKHRIIPTLLSRGGALVKGRGFKSDRVVGHVLQAARVHQARGVDELLIFDVAATPEGRGPDLALIEEITDCCFMPVSVGGGIRNVQDIVDLLRAGADKVVIGAAFRSDPSLVARAAERVGSQAISVAINYETSFNNQRDVEAAEEAQRLGAGEIVLQCIDGDGTMVGYDIPMIESVAEVLTIPVVASGGCSSAEDMARAINAGAHGVAAGAVFQFTSLTPRRAAVELQALGIAARVEA